MPKQYVTELDSKPIEGGGWYRTLRAAKAAARRSVLASPIPVWVGVVTSFSISFSVASAKHPDAHVADEIVESPIADLPPGVPARLHELPEPPVPGADDE